MSFNPILSHVRGLLKDVDEDPIASSAQLRNYATAGVIHLIESTDDPKVRVAGYTLLSKFNNVGLVSDAPQVNVSTVPTEELEARLSALLDDRAVQP